MHCCIERRAANNAASLQYAAGLASRTVDCFCAQQSSCRFARSCVSAVPCTTRLVSIAVCCCCLHIDCNGAQQYDDTTTTADTVCASCSPGSYGIDSPASSHGVGHHGTHECGLYKSSQIAILLETANILLVPAVIVRFYIIERMVVSKTTL